MLICPSSLSPSRDFLPYRDWRCRFLTRFSLRRPNELDFTTQKLIEADEVKCLLNRCRGGGWGEGRRVRTSTDWAAALRRCALALDHPSQSSHHPPALSSCSPPSQDHLLQPYGPARQLHSRLLPCSRPGARSPQGPLPVSAPETSLEHVRDVILRGLCLLVRSLLDPPPICICFLTPFRLGQAQLEGGQLDAALETLARAARLAPTDAGVRGECVGPEGAGYCGSS